MTTPKNILIICDQLAQGGLETHVYTQIGALQKLGFVVHLAVGRNFEKQNMPEYVGEFVYLLNVNSNENLKEFFEDVAAVRQIIVEKKISHVMAHPFTAPLVAIAAASGLNVTTSLTIHGPASLNLGGLAQETAKRVISAFDLVIFVSQELKETFGEVKSQTLMSPNSVFFQAEEIRDQYPSGAEEFERWLLVSRLDEDKFAGISKLLSEIQTHSNIYLDIIGTGTKNDDLQNQTFANKISNRVRFLGNSNDVRNQMKDYSVIVGMGRVAIEGIAESKNVLLLGYEGIVGFINQNLLTEAMWSNFSGRGMKTTSLVEALEMRPNSHTVPPQIFERVKRSHNLEANSLDLKAILETLSSTVRRGASAEAQLLVALADLGSASLDELNKIPIRQLLTDLARPNEHNGAISHEIVKILIQSNRQRDAVVAERDAVVAERDAVVAERDAVVAERDAVVAERDAVVAERDAVVAERDAITRSRIWRWTKFIRGF